MARLDALPSIDIIRGFKGVLDFYYWKGLPCVRRWPRMTKAKQSQASKDAAALFGRISTDFRLLAPLVLIAFQETAKGTPRTARDVYISATYGRIHEASMSDFLDLLTECRDFLSNLTALLNALDSINTDEIDVNVEHSVLPDGAATFARQTSMLSRLTEIADLQDALESKALDRFLVRGMDQLHSFKQVLSIKTVASLPSNNAYINSADVPPGFIWHITAIAATDQDRATTEHNYDHVSAPGRRPFCRQTEALGLLKVSHWTGHLWLDEDDLIRVYFVGGQTGDTCIIYLHGEVMTKET